MGQSKQCQLEEKRTCTFTWLLKITKDLSVGQGSFVKKFNSVLKATVFISSKLMTTDLNEILQQQNPCCGYITTTQQSLMSVNFSPISMANQSLNLVCETRLTLHMPKLISNHWVFQWCGGFSTLRYTAAAPYKTSSQISQRSSKLNDDCQRKWPQKAENHFHCTTLTGTAATSTTAGSQMQIFN